MNYYNIINAKHEQIKAMPGVEIHAFEIRDKCSEDELKQISKALQKDLPGSITDFYSQVNGFKLSWSCKIENVNLYGFCNILDIHTGVFGYNNQGSVIKENRFEDIFWNNDFPSEIILKLKNHYLLESFDGQSENTTYTINEEPKLYDVYEDEVHLYKITFQEYLTAIISWGGLFNLRQKILETGTIPVKSYDKESELWMKFINTNANNL